MPQFLYRLSRLGTPKLTLLTVFIAALCGCATDSPSNPSFPVTLWQAREDIERMERDPTPLARPVIVAGGFGDPGWVASALADRLRRLTSTPELVQSVAFFGLGSFDDCRNRLAETAESRFGSRDVSIDLIGISMGGIVARYACTAEGSSTFRPLAAEHIYTICTPHQGARLAVLPTDDQRQVDMRMESEFLARLNAARSTDSFELIAYSRLNDPLVGETLCAPPGERSWWVAHGPSLGAHMGASEDPRIVADIARRLRGESPWSTEPAANLP